VFEYRTNELLWFSGDYSSVVVSYGTNNFGVVHMYTYTASEVVSYRTHSFGVVVTTASVMAGFITGKYIILKYNMIYNLWSVNLIL